MERGTRSHFTQFTAYRLRLFLLVSKVAGMKKRYVRVSKVQGPRVKSDVTGHQLNLTLPLLIRKGIFLYSYNFRKL